MQKLLLAIFSCVATVCIAGDAARDVERELTRDWQRIERGHKKLAAQPTPLQWRSGRIWRFTTTTPAGKSQPPIIALRVTDEHATSCSVDAEWKNIWRKLVVVDGKLFSFGPPIYQVEGRHLVINLTGEICDAYDEIRGVLTNAEFKGHRITSGLGGGMMVGTVSGSCDRP